MATRLLRFALGLAFLLGNAAATTGAEPGRPEVEAALRRAVGFFHGEVARHGGYDWRYSGDLKLSEGEGITGPDLVWVQPPGTPAVGLAMLRVYEATGYPTALSAARDAANLLLEGQLRSGGWMYSVAFDPEKRSRIAYRRGVESRKQENRTTLDDDTTTGALRFLVRLDRTLASRDAAIHEAAAYGLESVLKAQYPNGAWYVWWENYGEPRLKPGPADLNGAFPETWSRTWTKDFQGCYVLNDNLMGDMVAMLREADRAYGTDRHRAAAARAGEFLLKAQMPEPQPAWAQQYDARMHPEWSRAFEPPAITTLESQDVLETLLALHAWTGDRRLLAPIPRALAYLRTCVRSDGKLPRFLELQTNRPLFFIRHPDRRYELTYSDAELPKHYGFLVDSRLDRIEAVYRKVLAGDPDAASLLDPAPPSPAEVSRILAALDDRGAWVERGGLDSHEFEPRSGIIQSQTFIANVESLCRYLARLPGGRGRGEPGS